MLQLERDICRDAAESTSREWLETNGIGGYASGTISGIQTRRYHGLLVAATRPPLGRVLLLAKFEEKLVLDGVAYHLSANRYPNAVDPQGYRFIETFRLDPFPIWTYAIDGVTVERRVFMVDGENTTVVTWAANDASRDVRLELRPLLAFRDHHHLRSEDKGFNRRYDLGDGVLRFRPYEAMPALHLAHNATAVDETGYWYRDLEYAIEQERGFAFREDLFQPCSLSFDLARPCALIASTQARNAADAAALESGEMKRRTALVAKARVEGPVNRQLVLAADQFIVRRGTGHTVIAGYPWFSDWGRDTMIALSGLTLATRRPQIARSIILEFARHISMGMLPNRFPDEGETPDYNTVDATLWYFEAIRAYTSSTGDRALAAELYAPLADIIAWHVKGTRYGIRVDDDGLLHAGEVGSQLTWMDAKADGVVFTPRIGKPVEIQALWYSALFTMAQLAAAGGHAADKSRFAAMAAQAKKSFREQFWNDADQCLFDVVTAEGKDASIRPNQIFAVSLTHTMLDRDRSRRVVKKVESELLTPVGLRSLGPEDISYKGTYDGGPFERDSAYHQGTVWAWLIGPFVEAYRKTHSRDARAEKRIEEILEGLRRHLTQAGIGQVSEIFDGDPPHTPRGCPAQAWSVAELLRISN